MVREVIFNKAGMIHSGFDYANLSTPYKSVGYEILNEGAQIRARKGDSSATYAAGGMYTTARDLYNWNLALQNNSIISQASLDEGYTPYKDNYGYGWYIETVAGIKNVVHYGGSGASRRTIKDFRRIMVVLFYYAMRCSDLKTML